MTDYCPTSPRLGLKKSPWITTPTPRDCDYTDSDTDSWYPETPSRDLIIFDITTARPVAAVTDSNRKLFYDLAGEWKRDTWHLSSVKKRMSYIAYLKIIGMGKDALPYIFESLRAEPDHWFGALEAITRENPAPNAQNMYELRDAWLGWAASHGY